MICIICRTEKPARRPCLEGVAKYCSRDCLGKANAIKRKGKRPYEMTDIIRERISKSKSGVKIWGGHRDLSHIHNPKHWFGSKNDYTLLHLWIIRRRGSARERLCNHCDKQAEGWANISHKYARNLNDYMPLCAACHKRYDMKVEERGIFSSP